MFARLTFIKILPEYIELHRKFYNEEVVPALRQHRGLIHVMLLEPVDKGGEFISVTEWKSQRDAADYESSGDYEELIKKIHGMTTREPVLKSFTIETVGAHRPMVY